MTDTAELGRADLLAIQNLIARYAVIVDGRDFDALDDVFTAGRADRLHRVQRPGRLARRDQERSCATRSASSAAPST